MTTEPPTTPPRWEPRVLPGLLLVFLVAVGGVRTVDLGLHGWTPSAYNEDRWLAWAWGQPGERELIPNPFRVDPQRLDLDPGQEVFLAVESPHLRAPWLRVMAQYALPAQPIVGYGPLEEAARQPEDVRVVHLDAPEKPLVAAVSPEVGPGRWERLAVLAGGLGAVLALGLALLLRRRAWSRQPATEASLAFAVGAVPFTLLAVGGLGSGLAGAWIPGVAWALATGLALRKWRRDTQSDPGQAPGLGPSWADGVWIALAGVFVARALAAPLWSWDHFGIWGAKARRIAAVGLGPDVLAPGSGDAFIYTTPHYPFGLPVLEAGLAAGFLPGGWLFRTLHLAWGLGLAILVRRASRSLGASPLAAAAAAALVVSSPLFMDTESLGLAEMPVAFWSVAAVALAFDPRERRRGRGWPVGLALGYLIWIKQEAWVLAALLGVVVLVRLERRRRVGFLAAVAGLAAGCAALQAWVGQEGLSFFTQGPLDRVVQRLPQAPEIFAATGAKLLAPQWLGFWFLLPAGLGLAAVRRRWTALLLGGVVVVQVLVYVGVYFASYVPATQHVDSSFFRIVAALVPLGTVALAAAWGRLGREGSDQDASEAFAASTTSAAEPSASSSGSSSLSPTFLA